MPHPRTFTSSAIGPCPNLGNNFLNRFERVSITWDDGFNFEDDDAWFRVFHQCEPPDVINIIDKLIEVHEYYDLILAWDQRVLEQCKNAVFLAESSCSWMDRKNPKNTGNLTGAFDVKSEEFQKYLNRNTVVAQYTPCDVTKKKFSVSLLTSSKAWATGHKLRHEIFDKIPSRIGDLEVFKHKSPPHIPDKRDVLEPFQFSIVPENSSHNNYFTEKIIDCFVAKTIPVYWGCPNIGRHFNQDAIIRFDNYDDLFSSLSRLTPEYYASRQAAIDENFSRALKTVHTWDLMEVFMTEAIEAKLHLGTNVPADVKLSHTVIPEYYMRRPLRTIVNPRAPKRAPRKY